MLTPPKSCLANATALQKVRQQADRYAIENALLWADGDYKEASRLLEIHHRGFHRFMKNINRGMFLLIAVNILLATFIYTSSCSAQVTPKRSLLALSKTNHTLAIVDPVTLKVIARIPVGDDPHEVIASSDGRVPDNWANLFLIWLPSAL